MDGFAKSPEIKLSCPGDMKIIYAALLEKLSGADGCHDLDHTLRVLHNAEKLLSSFPAADGDVVRIAALLHDIARPEEDRSFGKCCHAANGAKYAAVILKTAAVPPAVAAKVVRAIGCHRFRGDAVPDFIEAQILFDADKLDSLGAVGLGRAFLFAGHFNARLHNTADEALNSPSYSREDTAYREYLVKLKKLPERMFTLPGKVIAAGRLAYMEKFFSILDDEING